MPITMHGLDLSWMKDPKNRLPPEPAKPRVREESKRATGIAIPNFMTDIKPFVAHATKTPVEITSRSGLRRYERANGLKQAGDLPVGQIVAQNRKRHNAELAASKGVQNGWTDFSPETA